MSTKFTFPKAPKIGDRIEIVSISENKLPIEIVGNSEAGKPLNIIFPDQTYSGEADGSTVIASITAHNTVFSFKCVTAESSHTWLLEGTCLYSAIANLEQRVEALETALEGL